MNYEEFLREWRNNSNFISAQTSGSTGTPKQIFLDKDFVRQSAERTNKFFGLTSSSRLHSCISPEFIGGKMMAVRAELCGARLTWEVPSNQSLKSLNPMEVIDLLAIVPSQMIYLLENLEKLPEIKNVIIGGSPLHPELRIQIAEAGINAFETYGMTETASHIALRKIQKEKIPFKTLEGITVSKDEDDCLIIHFPDGEKIYTNDIAEVISEKEFQVLGRRDNILITGGKKLNPLKIEEIISEFIRHTFFIGGIPDEKWGQKVTLIVEAKPSEYNFEDLKIKMKSVLQSWQVPKDIIFTPRLKRTDNGKIIRNVDPYIP